MSLLPFSFPGRFLAMVLPGDVCYGPKRDIEQAARSNAFTAKSQEPVVGRRTTGVAFISFSLSTDDNTGIACQGG